MHLDFDLVVLLAPKPQLVITSLEVFNHKVVVSLLLHSLDLLEAVLNHYLVSFAHERDLSTVENTLFSVPHISDWDLNTGALNEIDL